MEPSHNQDAPKESQEASTQEAGTYADAYGQHTLPDANRTLLRSNPEVTRLLHDTVALYHSEETQNSSALSNHLTSFDLRRELGFESRALGTFSEVPVGKALELFERILYDLGAREEQSRIRTKGLNPRDLISSLQAIDGVQEATQALIDERSMIAHSSGRTYQPGLYLSQLADQEN
ncbi:MAG: hypothetical protein ACO3XO_04380 [Bdellovibrionota bacterium]